LPGFRAFRAADSLCWDLDIASDDDQSRLRNGHGGKNLRLSELRHRSRKVQSKHQAPATTHN
jgi:hypothetical protein